MIDKGRDWGREIYRLIDRQDPDELKPTDFWTLMTVFCVQIVIGGLNSEEPIPIPGVQWAHSHSSSAMSFRELYSIENQIPFGSVFKLNLFCLNNLERPNKSLQKTFSASPLKAWCDSVPSAPRIHHLLWTISPPGRWSTMGSDRGIAHFMATRNTIKGEGEKEQTKKRTIWAWVNSMCKRWVM